MFQWYQIDHTVATNKATNCGLSWISCNKSKNEPEVNLVLSTHSKSVAQTAYTLSHPDKHDTQHLAEFFILANFLLLTKSLSKLSI